MASEPDLDQGTAPAAGLAPGRGPLADLESWLRSPLRLTVLLVVATGLATAATSFGEVELRRAWGGGPEESDLVLRQGVIWLAWAITFLPLYGLAGAIMTRVRGWPLQLACHLPLAAAVASLFLVLENSLTAWVQGPERTAYFRERVLSMEDPSSTRRRPPWERESSRTEPPRSEGEPVADAREGGAPSAPDGSAEPAVPPAVPPAGTSEGRPGGARAPSAGDVAGGEVTEEDAERPGRRGRERADGRWPRGGRRRAGISPASGFVTGDLALDFERRWTLRVPRYALIYLALVGLGLGARAFLTGRTREREAAALELRTSQLEADLTAAQLSALKGQLHPHFLFNALHSVGGMIRGERSKEALGALARIGDLLRTSLDAGPEQFVSLERELELATRYLEVEELRLGERLRVEVDVPEELHCAEVPAFITQPLVENAVKHGIASDTEGGTVRLRAVAAGGGVRLRIDVEDDGPGFAEGSPEGVGLRHVRSRLAALFEGDARLELGPREGGGTRARLELPLDDLPAQPDEGATQGGEELG